MFATLYEEFIHVQLVILHYERKRRCYIAAAELGMEVGQVCNHVIVQFFQSIIVILGWEVLRW